MKYCFKHGDFEGDKCPKCIAAKPKPPPPPPPKKTFYDELREEFGGKNENVDRIIDMAEKMAKDGKV